jgi:hypothetical protein
MAIYYCNEPTWLFHQHKNLWTDFGVSGRLWMSTADRRSQKRVSEIQWCPVIITEVDKQRRVVCSSSWTAINCATGGPHGKII